MSRPPNPGPRHDGRKSNKSGTSTRLPRGAEKRARKDRGYLDPTVWRETLLASERGTIFKEAPLRIALCYPLPYHAAMSSLGFQVIYRMMNQHEGISCERVVLPDDVGAWRERGHAPISIETGRPLAEFDVVAFSITWDLDLLGFFDLLDLAKIPIERKDRNKWHPAVMMGGPLTASNPLPMADFIDFAVIGDGEDAVPQLLAAMTDGADRDDLLDRLGKIEGVWIPETQGDRIPATQKVALKVPAVSQIVTSLSELSNMFLVEGSRGCPRFCKFCMVRAAESPMRQLEVKRVMDTVPEWAERVGFVGAAVSEWEGIREAMKAVVDSGRGIGISSLRADRMDQEFVDLLYRGGARTMTIASDAPSQRQRNKMAKGIRTEHLWNSATLARDAGMLKIKLYVIIGLPTEDDADIEELIAFCKDLSGILPTALGVSPLVPKLHTPLGDAPFAGLDVIDAKLTAIRKGLDGMAEIRSTSAKWAWVEYRMSQGDAMAGQAALAAWREGGDFRAWERAFVGRPERPALEVANRHGLFRAAGMK